MTHLSLGGLLQLGKNHGRDLSRGELPLLAKVVDLDSGGSVLIDDLEGAAGGRAKGCGQTGLIRVG